MRKMGSVPIFLDYDQAALDAQYEQRTFVPHADEIIQRYGAASDAVRARLGEPETLAYGPSAAEALDLYGSGQEEDRRVRPRRRVEAPAPARPGLCRRDRSCTPAPPTSRVGFGLLPSITLPEMAAQVRQALIFIEARFKPEKTRPGAAIPPGRICPRAPSPVPIS